MFVVFRLDRSTLQRYVIEIKAFQIAIDDRSMCDWRHYSVIHSDHTEETANVNAAISGLSADRIEYRLTVCMRSFNRCDHFFSLFQRDLASNPCMEMIWNQTSSHSARTNCFNLKRSWLILLKYFSDCS